MNFFTNIVKKYINKSDMNSTIMSNDAANKNETDFKTKVEYQNIPSHESSEKIIYNSGEISDINSYLSSDLICLDQSVRQSLGHNVNRESISSICDFNNTFNFNSVQTSTIPSNTKVDTADLLSITGIGSRLSLPNNPDSIENSINGSTDPEFYLAEENNTFEYRGKENGINETFGESEYSSDITKENITFDKTLDSSTEYDSVVEPTSENSPRDPTAISPENTTIIKDCSLDLSDEKRKYHSITESVDTPLKVQGQNEIIEQPLIKKSPESPLREIKSEETRPSPVLENNSKEPSAEPAAEVNLVSSSSPAPEIKCNEPSASPVSQLEIKERSESPVLEINTKESNPEEKEAEQKSFTVEFDSTQDEVNVSPSDATFVEENKEIPGDNIAANKTIDIDQPDIAPNSDLEAPEELSNNIKMTDSLERLNQQQHEIADLKLKLNQAQQHNASLQLQIRQNEEIIIKTQAEALKTEQNYQQEVKQLKEKLNENSKLIEKDRIHELEEQLKEYKAKEMKLLSEISQKTKDDVNYQKITEQYEKNINDRIDENKKLQEECDTTKTHLANLELAFSDVHSKYEKTKATLQATKANEEALQANLEDAQTTNIQHEERYESLKAHARSQIEKSNKEIHSLKEHHEIEVNKLKAFIRRLEIKLSSLELSLQQKTEECEQLSALCDEVTGKNVSS
ncbi:unnamed protein product [Phyllotreta striolata]|uniref:Transforming acidic coiled-coil-containing protein C-terminal domain-containing protein n=1 Tax=Phyllotreta striolata TaxID=444603 RepID=A0A9N9XK86_PHYSR|nr:unnamed protein product [Phyllotreta striolata]